MEPIDDPYSWTSSSKISIDEFTSKYKPSMVQDDGSKPWLWMCVSRPDGPYGIPSIEKRTEALERAGQVLQEASEKAKAIQNHSDTLVRPSRGMGATRKEIQREYTAKLKLISQEYGYVHGKWLIFASPDKINSIWSKLAKSIESGPLCSTPIRHAKVSTTPAMKPPFYKHVICLYIPDVYNKPAVESMMRVLLRNHDVDLNGVKSDLYTLIGLYNKHPSGIHPLIWRNTDILNEVEIKKLKDDFYTGSRKHVHTKSKDHKQEKNKHIEKSQKIMASTKPKTRANPFGSDDE